MLGVVESLKIARSANATSTVSNSGGSVLRSVLYRASWNTWMYTCTHHFLVIRLLVIHMLLIRLLVSASHTSASYTSANTRYLVVMCL